MTSILTLCPTVGDATSFYRGVGPLGRLKQKYGIDLIFPDDVDWTAMVRSNICFLQRPYTDQHLTIARQCKDWNVPLWIDYDDLLGEITMDNPAVRFYPKKKTNQIIQEVSKLATVITVTTESLKKHHAQWCKDVRVIPNALDDTLLKNRDPGDRNKVIMWRGSASHARDLAYFLGPLTRAAENKDYKWYLLGPSQTTWMLHEQIDKDRVMSAEPQPIEHYFRLLHSAVRPVLLVAPLADTVFNRAKSNIVWLEAAYGGAAALVPDWEDWRRPGAIPYSDIEDFEKKLQACIRGEIDMALAAQTSWDYVRENLLLSKVNEMRWELIQELRD